MAAGAQSRLAALIVGAVMLGTLVGGSAAISFLPRFVLGGMLLMIGVDLLWQWGVVCRRHLGLFEWLPAVAMYLPALLAGLIGSCVLLAVSQSRVVVRHSYALSEASLALQRSEVDMRRLATEGFRARVIEFSGLLLFGSAHQLLAQVKATLALASVPRSGHDARRSAGAHTGSIRQARPPSRRGAAARS